MEVADALQVFGLESNSLITVEELKRIYRRLARDRHPDRTGGGSEDFIALQAAYITLQKYFSQQDGNIKSRTSTNSNHNTKKSYAWSWGRRTSTYTQSASTSDSAATSQYDTYSASQEEPAHTSHTDTPANPFSTIFSSTSSVSSSILTPSNNSSQDGIENLSKDELVVRLIESNQNLLALVANNELQKAVIHEVQKQVDEIASEYAEALKDLQHGVQHRIERVERSFLYRLWMNLFVTPITGKDALDVYQEEVSKYDRMREALRIKFNERLVEVYGEGLTKISKLLYGQEE